MRNSIELQMNQPLKYPSNDGSLNWPSMLSSFNSQNSQSIRKVSNLFNSFPKFCDCESENELVPKKLQQLDEIRIYQIQDQKGINQKLQRNYFLTYTCSKILHQFIILILSIILPYLQFIEVNKEEYQFEKINKIYNQLILIILILELVRLGIIFTINKLQLKTIQFNKIGLSILIIIVCIVIITTQIHFFRCLIIIIQFFRGFRIFKNILRTLILNYNIIIYGKIFIILLFQLHFFTCFIGYYQSQQDSFLTYSESFYLSFKFLIHEYEYNDLNGQWEKELLIINTFVTFTLIIYIFTQVQKLEIEKQFKSNALLSYQLYFYSRKMNFISRLILFNYSHLFFQQEKSQKQFIKYNQIISYIKYEIVYIFMNQLKFLSESNLEKLSNQGKLFIHEQCNENKQFEANLDGIYLFLDGNAIIEFQKLKFDVQDKQLTKLQIIETISINFQKQIKIINNYKQQFLYFYIDSNKFQSCFSEQFEKEQFQQFHDQICLYEDTSVLQIECIFCGQFHPSFICKSFNLKKRFQYNKTFQHRQTLYIRKNQRKSRAGIYEQSTNQGSSRQEVIELSSDSFEPFSDYSVEQQSHNSVLNSVMQFSDLRLKSNTLLRRDALHTELINDQILESLQLNSHHNKNQSVLEHNQFENILPSDKIQDLDTIFEIEIDQYCEFQTYNVDFNITNVIKRLNTTIKE